MSDGETKILLIEDDAGDADFLSELMQSYGQAEFRTQWERTLQTGLNALGERKFDLVLLDLGLPDCQGLETLQRIRNTAPATPIVVLTGFDDETAAVDAVKIGAQDYIVKTDLNERALIRAIRYALERDRLKKELERSETSFRNIVETTLEGIWIISETGITIFVNDQMCRMMGYSPEQMLGRDFTDFMDDEWSVQAREKLQQRRQGIAERYEFKFRRKDGAPFWSFISSNPLFDLDGNIVSVLGMMTDITERKREEEEREKLIQDLQEALKQVKTLSGLLPICSNCRNIRDDAGYWKSLESYVADHSDAQFSHSVCPDCLKKLYPDLYPDEEAHPKNGSKPE